MNKEDGVESCDILNKPFVARRNKHYKHIEDADFERQYLVMKTCESHGYCFNESTNEDVMELESQETITKFYCFLATLQFKLLKITSNANMADMDK